MVEIKGFKKTSLIDYPEHLCSTIFLGGCNFRCGFCHNPELVHNNIESVSENEVVDNLMLHKKNVEHICITGGEPLINNGIVEFLERLKNAGFKVKIDTNGSFPEKLKEIVDGGLVEYIAMDIKSSPEKYDIATGVNADIKKIERSIEIIRESGIAHEFRTTVVPGVVLAEDIQKIGTWLRGTRRFTLQQFRSTEDMLDNSLKGRNPYTLVELEGFKQELEKYCKAVRIVN